jgi:N,N'-diacetyllegionaminate synthase
MSKTTKTIVMSAGMMTEDELRRALAVLKDNDLVLLYCISCYPMKPEDANLRLIEWLKQFGRPVGWSDHEVGISVAPIAVALGARVVEKHFTLNRALPGFDHAMSLEPVGLKKCIRDIRKVGQAVKGLSSHREVLPCELKCFDQKRPTICSTRPIRRGESITRDMLTTKAPNRGLSPRFIPEILGNEAIEDIPGRHPHHLFHGPAMISVVIRTRNEEQWLRHCLSTVFRQDYVDFEVVLSTRIDRFDRGHCRGI